MSTIPSMKARYGKATGRLASESGQAAVMVLLGVIILVSFVAFSTNAGKLVNDRIRLQNASDMASYAGAARQAQFLNELRDFNSQQIGLMEEARIDLQTESQKFGDEAAFWSGICPNKVSGTGNLWLNNWKLRIEAQLDQYERVRNRDAADAAVSSAKETAEMNVQGTKGKLALLSHDEEPETQEGALVMPLKRGKLKLSYASWCYVGCPSNCTPQAIGSGEETTIEVETWLYKDSSQVKDTLFASGIQNTYFNNPFLDWAEKQWQIFTEKEPAVVDVNIMDETLLNCPDGFLPKNGRCSLSAYSVAKPFYGKAGVLQDQIVDQDLTPDANMAMAVAANCPDACLPRTDLDMVNPKRQFEDYKARFVGLFEQPNLRYHNKTWENLKCRLSKGGMQQQGSVCSELMKH